MTSRIPLKLKRKKYKLTFEKTQARKEKDLAKLLELDRQLLIVEAQIKNRQNIGGCL